MSYMTSREKCDFIRMLNLNLTEPNSLVLQHLGGVEVVGWQVGCFHSLCPRFSLTKYAKIVAPFSPKLQNT